MPNRTTLFRLFALWCVLAVSAVAVARPKSAVSAALDATALAPSRAARLAVVIDVPQGFHAQSHTPLDPALIKCEVTFDAAPEGITFGTPAYPDGHRQTYPLLGELSIYEGRQVVVVPIEVKASAGEVTLSGEVTLQLCDDSSCFPPDTTKFAIKASVVGDASGVKPANAGLFPAASPASQPPTPATRPAAAMPAAGGPPAPPVSFSLLGVRGSIDSLPAALMAALVAGLLFNLMPCVLPVLPLKAIGFYESSQHDRWRSLRLGIAFSAGVIAVFGALSLLVIFSRPLFGTQFSWGQQFSSPLFVAAVVVVLCGLGAGLLGAFAMRVPTALYGLDFRHDTLGGNVMWGGLTAVLSTPCTAPLFPLVIGFAMTRTSVAGGVLLVLAVGVGMALPYLVLSAVPELARRLPRTGPASELFKQAMAFPVFGTAAFFAGSAFGSEALQAMLVFGVAAAAGVFIVLRTAQLFAGRRGPVLAGSFAAVVIVGLTLWATLPAAAREPGDRTGDVQWVAYSPQSLSSALDSGRPVLVKFTAKWCANCIVLEKTVYRERRVIDALADRRVVAMKFDVDLSGWDVLNGLAPGAGIPYTALYVPGSPRPRLLASMHDADALVELLDGAPPAPQSRG